VFGNHRSCGSVPVPPDSAMDWFAICNLARPPSVRNVSGNLQERAQATSHGPAPSEGQRDRDLVTTQCPRSISPRVALGIRRNGASSEPPQAGDNLSPACGGSLDLSKTCA
jgi:hypothetical protein